MSTKFYYLKLSQFSKIQEVSYAEDQEGISDHDYSIHIQQATYLVNT